MDIHPAAAINFNEKATVLISLIKEVKPTPQNNQGFESDVPVSAKLSQEDIIGEIEITSTNYKGRTVARMFTHAGRRYGLVDRDYISLIELTEKIQSQPACRSKLSKAFIEATIFSWVKGKFTHKPIDDSFIEFLKKSANNSIKEFTLWTPIANLEIEISIPIARSELRSLSKDLLNTWEEKLILQSKNNKDKIEKLFLDLRTKFQGLASVVTKIQAEPLRAIEYAREEAELVTSVIAIFSDGALMPDLKCVSKIKGAENIASATTIMESEQGLFSVNHAILDTPSARFWRLDKNFINMIRTAFLDKFSALIRKGTFTKFEETYLNALLLYSKSAFTSEPIEKLVYMLSSLESILLKDENEPIQQNLAERLAILSAHELIERKVVMKTVKSVYAIRSRYLHHGHVYSELEIITKFMQYVHLFFINLIPDLDRFSDKDAFASALDDQKLS